MGFNGQSYNLYSVMTKEGLILSVDTSNFHRFGVYALPIEGGKWETMVHLKKNTVVIDPVSSKVLVNDRPVTGITTGKPVIVKDVSGQPIASVELKNKLSGMCGNYMPIVSQTATSQCVLSKPELEVASWMIPSASSSVSSSVPSHLMSELEKETEMCSKVMVQPTKVAKAYKAATGRCTIL